MAYTYLHTYVHMYIHAYICTCYAYIHTLKNDETLRILQCLYSKGCFLRHYHGYMLNVCSILWEMRKSITITAALPVGISDSNVFPALMPYLQSLMMPRHVLHSAGVGR